MGAPNHPDDASTILNAPVHVAGVRASRYRVVVVAGPDAGQSFEVDGSRPQRAFVGQGPACGLRLSDRHASRRHLALEAGESHLRMTDLGSKNGTWVNGVRTLDALLAGGETLHLGQTTLHIECVAAGEPVDLSPEMRFGRVLGASPAMRKLYPLLERLAASDVPLIVEGETGTGKELLSESVHEEGARAQQPFVVFDCTAISANLVESALFGHERGAFTGAVAARRGVFEQADGGTLFIDEIGDLELALQAKLLRAIERAEVQRVGSEKWTHVDVRIIAATRRDLDAEVQAKRFRDDLFFRLNVARWSCRRCGSAKATWDFWRGTSGEISAMAGSRSRRAFWSASKAMPGPGTCASCTTWSPSGAHWASSRSMRGGGRRCLHRLPRAT